MVKLVGVVLPGVVAVAARWPSLHQPLDRDTAAYATVGAAIWKGLLPYRDLFDHKQPLVYPIYAAIDLVGPRTSAVRVAGMAAAAITAIAIAILASQLLGRGRAILAACVVAIVSATPYVEGYDLNTEHLLAPLAALAVLVSLRYRSNTWTPAIAGLLLGLGIITKVVAVFAAPAVLLPFVSLPLERRRSRQLTMFAGAVCLPAVAVVLIYAAAGGMDALVDANYTYNRSYVAAGQPAIERFIQPVPVFMASLALVATLVGAARLLLVKEDRASVASLLLWLGGAWVGAKFSGRDYPHYFAPVVAPAILLLLVPIGSKAASIQLRRPLHGLLVVQLALLGWCLRSVPADMARIFDRGPHEVALLIFGDQARVWEQYEPVGAEIRARSQPGESLFVAGAEPGFYWFSGARVAGRYPYDYPVLADLRRTTELQEDLCRAPPSRVVLPYGNIWPPYLSVLDKSSYRLEFVRGTVHVFWRAVDGNCVGA